jgi:hypothetical protein
MRDRAFLKTLWETGNRVGEHLTLTLGSIEDLAHGMNLKIRTSKTEIRDNFIVFSVPDLAEWIEGHPCGGDKDAPLWIRIDGRQKNYSMSYNYAVRMIKRVAKRAGIEKKVNPHALRHGSASFWSNHLSDAQMKYKFGWVNSSKMMDIYIHQSSKAIRKRILSLTGVQENDEKPLLQEIPIVNCPFCGKSQDKSRQTCFNCKRLLQPAKSKIVQRLESILDDELIATIEENPAIFEQYVRRLKEKRWDIMKELGAGPELKVPTE